VAAVSALVPWNGGACPLAPETVVRVVRRYAGVTVGRAGNFRWNHDLSNGFGADDIVAFTALVGNAADVEAPPALGASVPTWAPVPK
jgi:hypothetical protein